MKRAIVIDANKQTVEIVDKEWTLEELQATAAGGGYITDGSGLAGAAVFVDDEGLIKDEGESKFFFLVPGLTREPLCGVGVVLGVTQDGETVSAPRSAFALVAGTMFFEARAKM